MNNIKPGNQALLALLEYTSKDSNATQNERATANELLSEILNDRFLFILNFHYDLHEWISGELTKIIQKDDLSYKILMETIAEKKQMLLPGQRMNPIEHVIGDFSLAEYISVTKENYYGAFKITSTTTRADLSAECGLHARRLIEEIEKRFRPSELNQALSFLFDPMVLGENRDQRNSAMYGRAEIQYLRKKYENLPDFDSKSVSTEWESLKSLVQSFIRIQSSSTSPSKFWKQFIDLKQITNEQFECECGYSAANRIQTIGRSKITTETLNCLLTVRLMLKGDIRCAHCHQIVEYAFDLSNNPESNRRLNRVQLLLDIPDDYEPQRQVRPKSNVSRRKRLNSASSNFSNTTKPKRTKADAIKCANRCGKIVSSDDPAQLNAILCCHQHDEYRWINEDDSCRRWLCNFCRVRLAIPTDTNIWFCEDHIDMHEEIEK